MVSQEDRLKLLEDSLADVLPESKDWARGTSKADPARPAVPCDHWLQVSSSHRADGQKLVLLLRHDGDIQIEYHVPGKGGTPFEALFPVPSGHHTSVVRDIARFVADLVNERLVLAYTRGLFGGGRQFLTPEGIANLSRRKLAWITSWRGTFDWQA